MKTQITILGLFLAILTSGCGTNPCDVSALFTNMTADQQASCLQCGNANGCDGETGGEVPEPTEDISCEPVAPDSQHFHSGRYCHTEWVTTGPDAGWTQLLSSDCALQHPTFPCDGNWSGLFSDECLLCEPQSSYPPSPSQVDTSLAGWQMCQQYGMPQGAIQPAEYLYSSDYYSPDWIDDLTCISPNTPAGTCALGFVAIDEPEGIAPYKRPILRSEWTCKCVDDSHCQPGAVCEAGWINTGGGWFQPSLCTWDDGSRTSNGAAPEGPEVYGLAQWGDGLDISSSGNVVTVTTPFVTAAVAGGLWNDDQRFTEFGEITHCGHDALCALFGLVENDVVDFDPADFVDLSDGDPVPVSILDATGAPKSSWTLVLAD